MFDSVKMECKVCRQEVDADLEAHGPGLCMISFSCGHTMRATKEKTVWINTHTNKIDLEEDKNSKLESKYRA